MAYLVDVNPRLFEPGDRLSLDEFLDRWDKMPDLKFAELIDGVVYMPSPVSVDHSWRDSHFHLFLATYALRSASYQTLPNATWVMLGAAPQPDIALRLLPQFEGKSTISSRSPATAAPQLS